MLLGCEETNVQQYLLSRFVVSMAYYGLSLNVGNLAGDLRINLLLSCSVELLGYLLAWVLLERLGRKRSHICFMLLTGLALLSTTLTVSLGGTGGILQSGSPEDLPCIPPSPNPQERSTIVPKYTLGCPEHNLG